MNIHAHMHICTHTQAVRGKAVFHIMEQLNEKYWFVNKTAIIGCSRVRACVHIFASNQCIDEARFAQYIQKTDQLIDEPPITCVTNGWRNID